MQYMRKHHSKTKRRCEIFVKLSQAEKEFFRRCYALNLSPVTHEQYEKVLRRLEKACKADGMGADADNINVEDISTTFIRYHIATLSRTLQAMTVRSHFMSLRSFFSFLYKEGITPKNVMENMERPKVPHKEIQAFTKEELQKILNAFDKNTFTGYRNYVITCVFFATGIRRRELINIQKEDIRFDINVLKIMGKGNKFRNIPITESLRKTLLKYIRVRQAYISEKSLYDSPYMFISKDGNKLCCNALSTIYRLKGKEEKINGVRVSPHTFRHTFAKFFLLNGGDVFTLQKLLGHSDISMTRRYVSLNDKDVKAQNEKYNPFENESWRYL